jgi:branched-chain amino acid transport system substrate-binding protein
MTKPTVFSRRAALQSLGALLASSAAPSLLSAAARPDQTITVGALLSITGNWSDLGTQARGMLEVGSQDLKQLLADYNVKPPFTPAFAGVDFEILIEDTQLDPQKAAAAAQRLIQRGAQFIIGPQSSAEVRAVKPITDAAGVVLVSPGSTAGTLSLPGDTVFRFVPDDSIESKAIAQVASKKDGIQAIVPVWRADDGNRGLVNALKNFGPGLNLQVHNGFEYATTLASQADFASLVTQVGNAVAAYKNQGKKTAVFLAAFDEGAALMAAALVNSDLNAVNWYAGDGITLSSVFLAPSTAQFAAQTKMVAAGLGVPESAQVLRDPILTRLEAKGLKDIRAFAFTAYDALACCTMAWILGSGEKKNIKKLLPMVAKNYFGTTGWVELNANGDRAVGDFEFWKIETTPTPAWKSAFTWEAL